MGEGRQFPVQMSEDSEFARYLDFLFHDSIPDSGEERIHSDQQCIRSAGTRPEFPESLVSGFEIVVFRENRLKFHFVAESGGVVVPEPCEDAVFSRRLTEMLSGLEEYRTRALQHCAARDFTRRAEVAVDQLEAFVRQRETMKSNS